MVLLVERKRVCISGHMSKMRCVEFLVRMNTLTVWSSTDMHIGQFLKVLDELDIADNTIVHYSTDNGPHMNTWPDAAMTPFFGEKNTNWEGGWARTLNGALAW